MAARVLLGIVAGLTLAMALALGAAAIWLWSAFAAPGAAVRSLGVIESGAPMVVIDVASVGASIPLDLPGRVELAIDGDTAVTVLAGPTADIDGLVFGSAYDVASLDDGSWSVTSVPGARTTPPRAPGGDIVDVAGDPAVVDIAAVTPGSLVIMRTEGDRSAMSLTLRLVVEDAGPIAMIGAGVAAFLLLVALVLLWAAVLGLRTRGRHE